MKSRKTSFDTASIPMVGSSRKRIDGRCSRAAARSHRIRCPRLSCRTGTSSSGPRSSTCTSSSSVPRYSSGGTLYMSRRSSNDSMTGRSHHSCVRCPNMTPMLRT